MANAGNAKIASSTAKPNGYETRPNLGHNPSRKPRQVIFGAGGSKSTPKTATPTTKS